MLRKPKTLHRRDPFPPQNLKPQGDNHRPACGGEGDHLRGGRGEGTHIRDQKPPHQGDPSLIHQKDRRGKEHSRPQGRRQGHGGDPVQDGFGPEYRPIAEHPIAQGPEEGHRSNTKEEACGEEPLGQRISPEPPLHPLASPFQPLLQPQPRAHASPQDHRKKQWQHVPGLQDHPEPKDHGNEPHVDPGPYHSASNISGFFPIAWRKGRSSRRSWAPWPPSSGRR